MNLSDTPGATGTPVAESLRLGVLVSGNGSNLQSIIDHCEQGLLSAEVVCVISNRRDAFALERARKHGIPGFHVDHTVCADREAFDAALVALLRQHGANHVILAGFNRLVSHILLEAFPLKIINIHPALLPAFPGGKAQRQALLHGVKIAGCTVHFIDSGTDTGPIIAQSAVPVLDSDTEETLSKRILVEEHKLYPQVIKLLAEGRVRVEGRKVLIAQ